MLSNLSPDLTLPQRVYVCVCVLLFNLIFPEVISRITLGNLSKVYLLGICISRVSFVPETDLLLGSSTYFMAMRIKLLDNFLESR